MKPEEAIRAIEVLRDIDINYPPTQQDVADTEGAIELAIQALEKQVAKKPVNKPTIIQIDGEDVIIDFEDVCECGKALRANWNGCPNCLTKIDWGKEYD